MEKRVEDVDEENVEGVGNVDDDEGDENVEGDEGVENAGIAGIYENVEGDVDERDVAGDEGKNGVSGQGSERIVEGEIPTEKEVVGDDDNENVEDREPTDERVDELESEGLKEIVDLEDGPESEKTPVDERTTRRTTHQSRKLQFGTQEVEEETGEDVPETEEDISTKAKEERLAAERKRNGKQDAKDPMKNPRQAPSTMETNESTPEAIRVPFEKSPEDPEGGGKDDEEADDDQPEESVYEKTKVLVTKKLLEDMARFDNPKKVLTYEERGAKGKLVKSGKCYHPESLQEIESDEEFLSYISAIGFEWLLGHRRMEVSVALAKEFFTTFKFKSTINPDDDLITFRFFNEEITMSIREWSLRMGLFTLEEDEDGIWNERMIGPPKNTPGFNAQKAWELITHKRGGNFKTSVSKGVHITDHLIRFAQVFIGYNLMGTASADITTPELYFT